jgi:hypothetical protein
MTTFFAAELTLDNPIAEEHGVFGAFTDIFKSLADEATIPF